MRAVAIQNKAVVVTEVADPTFSHNDVLVRVRSAGINGADILQRDGKYPAPAGDPQDIPGLEFAGEIVEIGAGVKRFAVGDRVMSIIGGGAQAEYVAVHERLAIPVPEELPIDVAGGFPEAFGTAYDALFNQANLQFGERLLVTGAAGGVGTAAIQLGVACGAEVYTSVRDLKHTEALKHLGAQAVFTQDQVTEYGPFAVCLELVGAPNLKANLRALETGGRIVVIGVGGGFKAEVNLLALMDKRASLWGSTLRSRPLEQKSALMHQLQRHTLPFFLHNKISVPLAASYLMTDVEAAYQHFSAGGKLGKVVLTFP